MYTKTQLEQDFGISDTTVYKTLQACGLDTAKQEYSQSEIEEFFIPARKLVEARKSYKEVEEFFRMKQGNASGAFEDDYDEEFTTEQASDASAAVGLTVAQSVQEMVVGSVKEVMPYVPALIAHAFSEELKSDEMREAFSKMRSQLKGKGTGAGAAFLQQQMGMSRNRLKPATEYRQLQEASPENSSEVSPGISPESSPENSNESSKT